MGKERLSYCGGTCKENSVKTELYNPSKPASVQSGGPVMFNRASFCLNHGCGWRQKYPAVSVDMETALSGKSKGINSYLRRKQRRFPGLSIKNIWVVWMCIGTGSFEEYLQEMESRKNA